MHAYIHTYIHAYIYTYVHTYIHTCIHTYIIHAFFVSPSFRTVILVFCVMCVISADAYKLLQDCLNQDDAVVGRYMYGCAVCAYVCVCVCVCVCVVTLFTCFHSGFKGEAAGIGMGLVMVGTGNVHILNDMIEVCCVCVCVQRKLV